MSTPDPAVPPPPNNSAKKWLVGCLVALLLVVLLGLAALLLIAYAAKRQVDAIKSDAQHLADDARHVAAALQPSTPVPPDVRQLAEARMRLGRAASAALASTAGSTEPCPTEFARSALPADAEWFTGLADGVPAPTAGTAWMRDPAIVAAASAADPQQAMIALDREFGDASAIAVIHATSPATTGDERQFQGYVQLIGYPDGETMCTVAFHAQGADGSAFQSSFWAAEEAALGK